MRLPDSTCCYSDEVSAALIVALSLTAGGPSGDAEGYAMVAKLWRGAKVRSGRRHGKTTTVIAPIRRKGELGFIDRVERRTVPGVGDVLAFSLRLAKDPENLEGWINGKWSPTKERLVAALILVAKGGKVSKPDGFPLERVRNNECIGDVCQHGEIYHELRSVDGSKNVFVLLVDPKGWDGRVGHVVRAERSGVKKMFEVEGPSALAGEIGCDASTTWKSLRWDAKKSQLVAKTYRLCHCKSECKDHGYVPGAQTKDVVLRPL